MNSKIIIVDYGMANLRSVQKAFEKMGAAAEISSDPQPPGRGGQVGPARRRRISRRHRPAQSGRIGRADSRSRRERQAVFRHLPGPAAALQHGYEDGVHRGLGCFPARWCVLRISRA